MQGKEKNIIFFSEQPKRKFEKDLFFVLSSFFFLDTQIMFSIFTCYFLRYFSNFPQFFWHFLLIWHNNGYCLFYQMIIDIYKYSNYVRAKIINIFILVENNWYLHSYPLSCGLVKTIRYVHYYFSEKKGDVVGRALLDELVIFCSFSNEWW